LAEAPSRYYDLFHTGYVFFSFNNSVLPSLRRSRYMQLLQQQQKELTFHPHTNESRSKEILARILATE
jgi:hypothetical protein